MSTHYCILTAYRGSTGTRVRKLASFSGVKLDGLLEQINNYDCQMGPSWDIHGEITSQQHYETRLQMNRIEESQWDKGLGFTS